MKPPILRTLAAVFLTTGVVFVVSSGVGRLPATLLSGQGSTVLQIEQSSLHAAAPENQIASRQLIMGILLILLALGIYAFWSLRKLPEHPSKRMHKTITRGYREWFWIKFP